MSDTSQSNVAISVVIPMYNAEKFIGACLSSILWQTFKNYEVIIVDDCSTDNSAVIVEDFIPQFGGRLKILRTENNSGVPGTPINRGVALAGGKYIYAMDDDDLIIDNALETLYNFAEAYQADVVYTERYFYIKDKSNAPFPNPENVHITQQKISGKPTLETENIAERVEKFLANKFEFPAWNKLVRRDLLTENEISFPAIRIYHDLIWSLKVIYFAKKILKIPDALYFYRIHSNSLTQKHRTNEEFIKLCLTTSVEGIGILDKFLSGQKFFQGNPQYHCALLNFFEMIFVKLINRNNLKIQPHEVYKIGKFGEYGNLIAYLCASSNFSQLGWIKANQQINQLMQRC